MLLHNLKNDLFRVLKIIMTERNFKTSLKFLKWSFRKSRTTTTISGGQHSQQI